MGVIVVVNNVNEWLLMVVNEPEFRKKNLPICMYNEKKMSA